MYVRQQKSCADAAWMISSEWAVVTDGFFSLSPRIAGAFLCGAMLVGIRRQTELHGGFPAGSAQWKLGLQGEEPELDQMVRAKPKSSASAAFAPAAVLVRWEGKSQCNCGKAHLFHSSSTLVERSPKYFILGHTKSLNQVNQSSSVSEEREGLLSPANTVCKWEGASGLVSVKLSKALLVAASFLTAFRRVLPCLQKIFQFYWNSSVFARHASQDSTLLFWYW